MNAEPEVKVPSQWPMVPASAANRSDVDHAWHVAINHRMDEGTGDERMKVFQEARFMYDAKSAAAALPSMAYQFKKERMGELRKVYQKCSCCTDAQHVVDNHLTCCLGVECRKCPHLLALNSAKLEPEQIDWIKAWTCAAHIVSKGGDVNGEGFILATDDRMFWDSVYKNRSSAYEDI